jgi:large conductance mechanosensitive channel
MLADFKKFILRGNVLDLAVAVVIGAAFGVVVKSFLDNILMQFIGGLFGKADFSQVMIVQNSAHTHVYLKFGAFLTDVINFVIIAFAIFMVVKAAEKLQSMRRTGEDEPEPLTDEAQLLTEIRDLLQQQRAS